MLLVSFIFVVLSLFSFIVATEEVREAGASVFFLIIFSSLALLFMHIAGKESVAGVTGGEIYDISYGIGDRVVVADKLGIKIKITFPERISTLADGRVVILK